MDTILQKLRTHRIFNVSIIDTVGTIFIAFLLHRYFFKEYDFLIVLLSTFLLGIVTHRVLGIKTQINIPFI